MTYGGIDATIDDTCGNIICIHEAGYTCSTSRFPTGFASDKWGTEVRRNPNSRETIAMVGKMTFLAGAAAGYVLGAKAGREQYEKIMAAAKQVNENPKVQQAVETVTHKGTEIIGDAKEKIGDKVPGARQSATDDATAGSTSNGTSASLGAPYQRP